MNSLDFKVGEKTYELKLTTRGVVKLEKAIKKNPVSMFINGEEARVPNIEEGIITLYFALQPNHGAEVRNVDAVYDIYDEYVENGGTFIDLMAIIVDLFRECGIMPKEEEQLEKN